MNRKSVFLWLLGALLWLVPPTLAGSVDQRPRSVLEGEKALDQPVTYAETRIPLGELVAKVASDAGVKLMATRDAADEPVAVVVKQMPARELLEQLAELLDYRWGRQGHEGAWRYEIYQDLAGKQREEALREARIRDVERRFQETIRRYAEVAALPPAQIQALGEESDKRSEELAKLTPEQRLAVLRSPEEWERMQRPGVARPLSVPIPRALARLIGQLSPPQWALLRAEQRLTFSTDPQAGEQPLPEAIADALRASPPRFSQPGVHLNLPTAEMEEQMRQWDKAVQEQWAVATGYRVTLQLDADHLKTAGSLMLTASAAPIRSGEVRPSFFHAGGATLHLGSGPVDFADQVEDQSSERQAALEKDPVVGVKKRFKPEAKPRPVPFGPQSPSAWQFRDLLPDLARTFNVQILADASSTSATRFLMPADLPSAPTALFVLLDRLSDLSDRWDQQGRLIRLRSRKWFLDRPREIPMRLVRRWKMLFDQYGALPRDEYLQMVTELSDAQLECLPLVSQELGLSMDVSDLFEVRRGRDVLRLYASLSPGQRQMLEQGATLAVAPMRPPQREWFLAATRPGIPYRPAPSLEQWAAGGLAMTVLPSVRTIDPHEGRVTTEIEPAADAPAAARTPGSGPAPAPPSPAPTGPAVAPSARHAPRSAGSAPASGSVARHRVKQINFQLEAGPLEGEHSGTTVNITVASPS